MAFLGDARNGADSEFAQSQSGRSIAERKSEKRRTADEVEHLAEERRGWER